MTRLSREAGLVFGLTAAAATMGGVAPSAHHNSGARTSQSAYVVPVAPHVKTEAILSVGDSVGAAGEASGADVGPEQSATGSSSPLDSRVRALALAQARSIPGCPM